jgi:DNA-binding transcriptional MocR family regulator
MAAREDSLLNEGLPRYAQIQKSLEQRLIDGVYPIGSLMPSEQELSQEFNSSRTTIREALRYLRERGYVERRQGVGTPGHIRHHAFDLFPVVQLAGRTVPGGDRDLLRGDGRRDGRA